MGGRFSGGPTMLTTMTEEDWTIVLKVFEASRPRRGDKGRDDRTFLEALHYFVVHNITWRALPEKFGHWNSVWKRFWRLSQSGTFEAFFDALAALSETAHLVQMFDSTVVRAHVSARTTVESNICTRWAVSLNAASASKKASKVPDWLKRQNRFQTLFQCPNFSGRARQVML